MMIDTGSFGAQMTEQTENNIAAEPTEEHVMPSLQDEGTQAPEFTADAPGFDMLADADADNEVENGAAPISGDDGSYKVLARKYRPRNFDDLIGQEAMVQTLTNAFDSGRIAHGFMLTGVRGVGKTTTARILARALNYQTEAINAPSMAWPKMARIAKPLWMAAMSMSLKWTPPRAPALAIFAKLSTMCATRRAPRVSKSILLTKCICCRKPPSTDC